MDKKKICEITVLIVTPLTIFCIGFYIGQKRLILDQMVSADLYCEKVIRGAELEEKHLVITQECDKEIQATRDDLDDFTYGLCNNLGLIKGG